MLVAIIKVKMPWKKCKPKYPKYLLVLKISKKYLFGGGGGGGGGAGGA